MVSLNAQMMNAAEWGNTADLEHLLAQSECSPLFKDKEKNNMTALMWAACRGHELCVKLLLPVSDTRGRDRDGTTALMFAAAYGKVSCVERLIPVSNVLAKNGNGMTALMWAASEGDAESVKQLLLASDTGAQCDGNKNAADYARFGKFTELADFLDAYNHAVSERSELCEASGQGAAHKKAALRM